MIRPYMDICEAVESQPNSWMLEDGSTAPAVVTFAKDAWRFNEPHRIFRGTISWPSMLEGCHEWDIVLGFSSDYRSVTSGSVHQKRGRAVKPEDLPASLTEEEKEMCKHPMDGKWMVVWKDAKGVDQRKLIKVEHDEFKQGGWSFSLHIVHGGHAWILARICWQ